MYSGMAYRYQPPSSSGHLIPYRDSTGAVKYCPAPSPFIVNPRIASDSDHAPLIASSIAEQQLDDEAIQNFTATGRPMPTFKASGLSSLSGNMYSVPQLLPTRYTDESIIPAIVVDVIPCAKPEPEVPAVEEKLKKSSFLSKLKPEKVPKPPPTSLTKVVYMPRGEYLKHFARDYDGNYIGTEPYKRWTEEELEKSFGHHRPVKRPQRRGWRSGGVLLA